MTADLVDNDGVTGDSHHIERIIRLVNLIRSFARTASNPDRDGDQLRFRVIDWEDSGRIRVEDRW